MKSGVGVRGFEANWEPLRAPAGEMCSPLWVPAPRWDHGHRTPDTGAPSAVTEAYSPFTVPAAVTHTWPPLFLLC